MVNFVEMIKGIESDLQVYHGKLCKRINYLHKEIKDLRKLINPYVFYDSGNSEICKEINLLKKVLRKVTMEKDEVDKEIELRHIHSMRDGLANLQAMFETFYDQQVKEKKARKARTTNSPSLKVEIPSTTNTEVVNKKEVVCEEAPIPEVEFVVAE